MQSLKLYTTITTDLDPKSFASASTLTLLFDKFLLLLFSIYSLVLSVDCVTGGSPPTILVIVIAFHLLLKGCLFGHMWQLAATTIKGIEQNKTKQNKTKKKAASYKQVT
jgi:hypothetical protein